MNAASRAVSGIRSPPPVAAARSSVATTCPAVSGIVARSRLNPYILESRLPCDPAVRHTIQGNAPGDAQVLGAGRLPQPVGASQQHLLGVVLHAPGHVFPVRQVLARFPVLAAIGPVELCRPLRDLQRAVLHVQQRLKRIGPAVRREPHDLAAFVPVGEDVARHPAIEGAEPGHEEELIAQEAACRLEPDLLQRFELRAFELVVALRLAGERIDAVGELALFVDVGAIIADAIDDHHHAFIEGRCGERAVGMREVV